MLILVLQKAGPLPTSPLSASTLPPAFLLQGQPSLDLRPIRITQDNTWRQVHGFPGLHHGPIIWGTHHSAHLISLLHFSCFLKLNLCLKIGTPILLTVAAPQYQGALWKGGVPRRGDPLTGRWPSAPLTVSHECRCKGWCLPCIPRKPPPRTHGLMSIGSKGTCSAPKFHR